MLVVDENLPTRQNQIVSQGRRLHLEENRLSIFLDEKVGGDAVACARHISQAVEPLAERDGERIMMRGENCTRSDAAAGRPRIHAAALGFLLNSIFVGPEIGIEATEVVLYQSIEEVIVIDVTDPVIQAAVDVGH